MTEPVVVNVYDQTGAVSQKGFGVAMIFDPSNTNPLEEVTSTDEISNWTSGDLAYEKANAILSQEPKPTKVMLYGVDIATEGTTIADELDDLVTQNNDWYALDIASRTEADITAAADWVASKEKIMFGQLDIATTPSEIETYMGSKENQNFALFAHDGGVASEEQYFDSGALGVLLPMSPGSYTMKFKTVNNVAGSTFKPGENSTIIDANANTYVEDLGENYIAEGVMSNGEFLDNTVVKHWFAARYREEIFRRLKVNKKIPFDDVGIAQIVAAVKKVNKVAANNGVVAQDVDGNFLMSVTYPRRRDILENDLANRVLKGVESTVVYSGAIHNVELDFVLTL